MSYELNDKLKKMTPYEPVDGNYRIRLDANESFLPPSQELKNEIISAVSDVVFNRYPESCASELCRLFGEYYGVRPSLVTAGNGSDELISVIAGAFLQKGESMLCFTPDFSMYRFYSEVSEAKIIEMKKGSDYSIDVDAVIEAAAKNDVRLVIFSNPCNPTSTALSHDEVLRLVRGVDALVVVDEAYMDFCDGESVLGDIERLDNCIVLRTCSKAIGMAGIRLGFAVANEKISTALRCVKSPYNVNSITQAVGCVLFSHPEVLRRSTQQIITSRKDLCKQLEEIAERFPNAFVLVEGCANFAFLECERSSEIFEYLKKRGIIVRCFGKTLRITAGRNHENKELCAALTLFFEEKETLK